MSTRLLLVLAVLGPLAVSGCERPDAEFVFSSETSKLATDGSRAVRAAVQESFGTPQELVAWLKLPVDFGNLPGQVVESASPQSFKVAFAEGQEVGEIEPGMEMLFPAGSFGADAVQVHVDKYDAETSTVTIREAPSKAPNAGARFILHPAQKFRRGYEQYSIHCMHCHGVTGDGNGPTAPYLNPRPRDYRKGVFKFTSTMPGEKPTTDDLTRIVKHGIPGTYMPSFMLLPDDDVDAIVEYVRWLSMRGELEQRLVTEFNAEGYSKAAIEQRKKDGEKAADIEAALQEYIKTNVPELVQSLSTDLGESWVRAETPEMLVKPGKPRTESTPESIARGRELFVSARAKCTNCHGMTGEGNGPQTEDFETDPATNQTFDAAGLHDDWGFIVPPRNLTTGVYRGGRRPIDLYRRIYTGIKGAKMPAFGGTVLNDDEIWDLVNYVLHIPHAEEGVGPRGDSVQSRDVALKPAQLPAN